MSAPSTPIRAITSTLSLRSAPSIPPPSKTYEPLLKAILHNRLIYSIFLYSAAFTWAVVALYLLWLQGGTPGLGLVGAVLSPISPWTVLFALAAWLLGVLPVIILRKAYLTGQFSSHLVFSLPSCPQSFVHSTTASPTAASSPSRSFQLALTKQSTSHFALVYTTSAVLLTILHISLSYTYEPALGSDPKLTVFVKSKYVLSILIVLDSFITR